MVSSYFHLLQNRYFVIKETGVLVQYKKQDKAGATLGTLDLSRVLGVTHHYGPCRHQPRQPNQLVRPNHPEFSLPLVHAPEQARTGGRT